MSVLMVQQSALRFTPPPARARGQRPVRLEAGPGGFRFTEIGTGKKRWDLFGVSAIFQISVLMTLAWLPILYMQGPPPVEYTLTVMTRPLTEYTPPKRNPIVARRTETQPVEAEPVVKPAPKLETRLAAPQLRRREMRPVETPQMAAMIRTTEMEITNARAEAARAPVVTGVLKTPGTSEQPTLEGKRVDEVQTGGFGDPNGVPAKGNPNKPANINRIGSFGMPPGYGYGNGTGGTKGTRGVVASAGFGNGVSKGDPGARGSSGRGGVQGTSFDSAAPSGDLVRPAASVQPAKANRTPVEILQKPNPRYTDEARKLRIEGNVKLRVVFTAGGELRIVGVQQGLGHGLDEAAVAAAKLIRFRPAREGGRAVDEPAIVTIEFKLAF